jgi:hypothetical protein
VACRIPLAGTAACPLHIDRRFAVVRHHCQAWGSDDRDWWYVPEVRAEDFSDMRMESTTACIGSHTRTAGRGNEDGDQCDP